MKNGTRERFTLRMPTALYNTLQMEADKTGVSLNALILQILWEWVQTATDDQVS